MVGGLLSFVGASGTIGRWRGLDPGGNSRVPQAGK